jgi:hypothetical protein
LVFLIHANKLATQVTSMLQPSPSAAEECMGLFAAKEAKEQTIVLKMEMLTLLPCTLSHPCKEEQTIASV